MNVVERLGRRLDEAQQRHVVPAVTFGVVKKFGDDNAGNLTVQLTYSMFVTVFPLLLLAVTILNLVASGDPGLRHRLADSAFGQFPIVGTTLSHNIHVLRRNSIFGLVVGVVGLVYGATGLAQSGLFAMEQVWNIPGTRRPSFLSRMLRSLAFLAFLGLGLVLTTGLAGLGTFGRHAAWAGALGEAGAVVCNVGLYLGAFRILTPKQVGTRSLVPGAILGGVAWTILQALGGYVVGHDLKGASAVYGMFGLVLGLVAWIYLGAELTLYSAELNTVLHHRLWPRAMVQPPLTEADQRSLALQAVENQRRPEQRVRTHFEQAPMTQRDYRRNGYHVDEERTGVELEVPEDRDAPSQPASTGGPAAPSA